VVYLIHAADGCLPSDMSTGSEEELEEELRLAYVAMTRARNFLYITWPLRYYHRWSNFTDRHVYAQLSRFLTEEVQATCTLESSGLQRGGAEEEGDRATISARVRQRLDAIWD